MDVDAQLAVYREDSARAEAEAETAENKLAGLREAAKAEEANVNRLRCHQAAFDSMVRALEERKEKELQSKKKHAAAAAARSSSSSSSSSSRRSSI